MGESVLAALRKSLNPQLFETWFSKAQFEVDHKRAILVVKVPNRFYRDWIGDHYSEDLRRAAFTALGSKLAVELVVESALVPPPAAGAAVSKNGAVSAPRPPAARHPYVSEHSDVQLNAAYTFANFVVGPNNQLAHAAALAVVEKPGTAYNPLFVHGSVGLGKTHLLQAICHVLIARKRPVQVLYLSCETFVNHFILAVGKGDLEKFRFRYRHVDLLLIDDIQLIYDKVRSQEEFFHTFNTLHNAGKQIVLSSDKSPEDIRSLEDRLVSRFASGFVVKMEAPSFETRVAIVQNKSRLLGKELPLDVARFVAEKVSTNIRELEGAVVKVIGFANLMHRAVDISLAQEAFREGKREAPLLISLDGIVDSVIEVYGVKKTEMQSKRRLKSISLPRQICMYLARRLTRLSLEEIGGFFGGRDHTTVLYATEKIGGLVVSDARLAATVHAIESRLKKLP